MSRRDYRGAPRPRKPELAPAIRRLVIAAAARYNEL